VADAGMWEEGLPPTHYFLTWSKRFGNARLCMQQQLPLPLCLHLARCDIVLSDGLNVIS
jgi:hypothetical protein